MTTIRLTWEELLNAATIGVYRNVSAIRRGRPAAYRADAEKAWQNSIEGAAAEMAVAKYLGVYWQPLAPDDDLRRLAADVGDRIQVRSTSRTDRCLIVHPSDCDDHLFYLVIWGAPRYTIIGWTTGREAKQPEFWKEDPPVRHPAFFVPQDALHPCVEGFEALDYVPALSAGKT